MNINPSISKEIERLFGEYEKLVHETASNGYLQQNTVRTYLLHSKNFVRWCNGDFIPGSKNMNK